MSIEILDISIYLIVFNHRGVIPKLAQVYSFLCWERLATVLNICYVGRHAEKFLSMNVTMVAMRYIPSKKNILKVNLSMLFSPKLLFENHKNHLESYKVVLGFRFNRRPSVENIEIELVEFPMRIPTPRLPRRVRYQNSPYPNFPALEEQDEVMEVRESPV